MSKYGIALHKTFSNEKKIVVFVKNSHIQVYILKLCGYAKFKLRLNIYNQESTEYFIEHIYTPAWELSLTINQ